MPSQQRPLVPEQRAGLRGLFARIGASTQQRDADELLADTLGEGCTPVADARAGDVVTVSGTLRSVTLQPRTGIAALEAELFDGSSAVVLVWLGRRQIGGIEPGRRLFATGRVTDMHGARVIFNPRYTLRASA